MVDVRRLGVHGETGQPVGDGAILPSPMNVVEAIGRFSRIFDNVMVLNGSVDKDYILGSPQSGKLTWYIMNDAIQKALPYSIEFHIKSFKGSGAVQASSSLLDGQGSPATTVTLKDAYRNNDAYGVWGDDSGFRVDQGVIFQTSINATAGATPNTITLKSVVGVKVGSTLRITHSATDYGFTVASIDENAKTVTGTPDSGITALAVDDVVKVVGFKITAVRRDFRGQITKQQIPHNDLWLSMEPSNVDEYIVTVFKNHPLFKAVDASSAGTFWKKFPAQTADGVYVFLASGADGAAPSSTSDWTGLQSAFVSKNTFAFLNAESTSQAVSQNFEAWVRTRQDYPVYISPIQNFTSDWQSLRDFGLGFIRRQGWNQIGLFYGWRYVPDPIGDGSNPVKQIPVCGGVLGNWIKVIYSGFVHRAPAETRFPMSGYVDGPEPCPEDLFDDDMRTELYKAGINIVRNVSGFGVLLRNFRSPSDDYLVRDLHIHAINQLIKFTCEQNFQVTENTPNQWKLLQRDKARIDHEILKPLFEGNFAPFCVDQETGAFRNTNDDDTPAQWFDMCGARADRFNNPPAQFDQGDADIWPEWVPYSLRRSLKLKVYTAVKIFSNRG